MTPPREPARWPVTSCTEEHVWPEFIPWLEKDEFRSTPLVMVQLWLESLCTDSFVRKLVANFIVARLPVDPDGGLVATAENVSEAWKRSWESLGYGVLLDDERESEFMAFGYDPVVDPRFDRKFSRHPPR